MTRITEKQLKALIDYLNELTGSPSEPYSKNDKGDYAANIGNYHLDCAYGGYALNRMSNKHGGVRSVFTGHGPKRQLYDKIHAIIQGINIAKS